MVNLFLREKERTTLEEFSEDNFYVWEGQIKEGFMMGNQITKVLLHLCHVSERAMVNLFLREKGIVVRRTNEFGIQRYRRIQGAPYNYEDRFGLRNLKVSAKPP